MATTSPDNLTSPDGTDPYNLTADWAASMASVQAAFTNRATRLGTTSQRTSATNLTPGLLWSDTTTQSIWRWNGTTWVELTPAVTAVITDTSGIFTPASGISVTSFVAYRVGDMVTITAVCTGTFAGANTAVSVGTLAVGWRPRADVVGAAYYSTTGALTGIVRATGLGAVTALKPDAASRGSATFTLTFVRSTT